MRNTRDVQDDASAVDETVEVEATEASDDVETAPTDVEVHTEVDSTEVEVDAVEADAVEADAAETGAALEDTAEPAEAARTMIDPRGPRFGAAITVVVLALVLLTIPGVLSVVLLVWQAIAFGAAALFGIQAQPYGILYRSSVAPRLGPPTELEDAAPPRFAQQVGLVFVLVALVGLAFGAPMVAYIATAFALAAAFLNAAFNFCLGCEIYLLVRRFSRA